eukprot:144749-Rhodomonas_salina.1
MVLSFTPVGGKDNSNRRVQCDHCCYSVSNTLPANSVSPLLSWHRGSKRELSISGNLGHSLFVTVVEYSVPVPGYPGTHHRTS